MTASNSIDIDGQTGGVVSNFPPLEGTGAGNTTQETTELEISGRQDFFAGKKISMPGVSL